jgi:hypothetical protein
MHKLVFLSALIFLKSCDSPSDSPDNATKPVTQAIVMREQPQTDCLIENKSWNHVQPDPVLTKACKERMAQGWRLLGSSNGQLIWVR